MIHKLTAQSLKNLLLSIKMTPNIIRLLFIFFLDHEIKWNLCIEWRINDIMLRLQMFFPNRVKATFINASCWQGIRNILVRSLFYNYFDLRTSNCIYSVFLGATWYSVGIRPNSFKFQNPNFIGNPKLDRWPHYFCSEVLITKHIPKLLHEINLCCRFQILFTKSKTSTPSTFSLPIHNSSSSYRSSRNDDSNTLLWHSKEIRDFLVILLIGCEKSSDSVLPGQEIEFRRMHEFLRIVTSTSWNRYSAFLTAGME